VTTAITATLAAGTPVKVVQLNVTIDNPGQVASWTIYRDSAADAMLPVWLGTTTSGAMSLTDYTAPLSIPVTYRLKVVYTTSTVTVASAPVTITSTGCYLTNPAAGSTVAVQLVSWPDRTREPRQAALDVAGRADPVVLSDLHATPTGAWRFGTDTDTQTAALLDVLTGRAIAVLRTQPGSSIPAVTVAVGQVTEVRRSGKGGDPRRWVDVEVQEIAPLPATALPINATLGGLAVYQGTDTLAKLAQLRSTLQQLSEIPCG
jgi:hypothetical protein